MAMSEPLQSKIGHVPGGIVPHSNGVLVQSHFDVLSSYCRISRSLVSHFRIGLLILLFLSGHPVTDQLFTRGVEYDVDYLSDD